jgi:hypothetical protein
MNHHFIHDAVVDMRCGRQSWRVLALFSIPAFVVSFGVALLRRFV